MRRNLVFAGLLALVASLGAFPAKAEDEKKFDISGEVRARWEYSANTIDGFDDAVPDDNGDFFPYRMRLGVRGNFSEHVSGHVEFQNFGFFGNEPPGKSTGTPLGQASSFSGNNTDLYQGYLQIDQIRGSAWGLRIGRQEHTLGNELQLGDGDFYNGVSFDGLRFIRDTDRWDLNIFYYITNEVGANLNDQTELWGASADFNIGDDGQHIEPYLLGVRNTTGHPNKSNIWTAGALWARPWSTDHAFDWSAEAAYQTGDAPGGPVPNPNCTDPSKCDVSAYIVEGWFGFSFGGHSRVHVGALMASGDDDSTDTDSEAYVPLFPDDHANNRLGDLDLFGGATFASNPYTGGSISNITDVNVGYGWRGDKNKLMASFHNLTLTEEDPVTGEDAIGNEVDLSWDHQYSDIVSFEVGLADLMAGDLLDAKSQALNTADADDAVRAWWQLRLRWN